MLCSAAKAKAKAKQPAAKAEETNIPSWKPEGTPINIWCYSLDSKFHHPLPQTALSTQNRKLLVLLSELQVVKTHQLIQLAELRTLPKDIVLLKCPLFWWGAKKAPLACSSYSFLSGLVADWICSLLLQSDYILRCWCRMLLWTSGSVNSHLGAGLFPQHSGLVSGLESLATSAVSKP